MKCVNVLRRPCDRPWTRPAQLRPMPGSLPQKRLVVADDQQRAVIGAQARLDRFDGSDVEMVDQLVEDQQGRRRHAENAGETDAGAGRR